MENATYTCQWCGKSGPLPSGRGTRVKKYCSAHCKARASTSAARAGGGKPVRCGECGEERVLLYPGRAGEMCRRCASTRGSEAARTANRREPVERFMAQVDQNAPDGCWLWTGHLQRNGYGAFGTSGRTVRAHRWSYEHHVGPIPAGLQIDHLCRVRSCVNPAHLEPVTARENSRRAMKAHCPHGHAYTEGNTYMHNGKRHCRECRRRRVRARREAGVA